MERITAGISGRPSGRSAICAAGGSARWLGSATTRTAMNGRLCAAAAWAQMCDSMSTATAPVACPSAAFSAGVMTGA